MPGFIISAMNAYYVFLKFAKLWDDSRRHVPPHPHAVHVDTARTWRGGQNQVLLSGHRPARLGQPAVLVAHAAGELKRRASEGLRFIGFSPRSEFDVHAAWQLARVLRDAAAGRRPRARSDGRRARRHGAADEERRSNRSRSSSPRAASTFT